MYLTEAGNRREKKPHELERSLKITNLRNKEVKY